MDTTRHKENFNKRHAPMEWARLAKDYVYIMAEDPEREFCFLKN